MILEWIGLEPIPSSQKTYEPSYRKVAGLFLFPHLEHYSFKAYPQADSFYLSGQAQYMGSVYFRPSSVVEVIIRFFPPMPLAADAHALHLQSSCNCNHYASAIELHLIIQRSVQVY